LAKPDDPNNPPWLPERLKSAKATAQRELLESLGVKDGDELKTALAELKTLKTSTLTEAQQKDARIKELEPQAAEALRVKATLKALVDERFAALPEAQQQAIDAIAEGDPERRLQMLRVRDALVATQTPTTPAAPPKPTPATTTPPGAPPAPATPAAPDTPFTIYERKLTEDPMGASIFYRINAVSIEKSRPTTE